MSGSLELLYRSAAGSTEHVAVLPWLLGSAGGIYGAVAVAAGAIMMGLALRLCAGENRGEREARRLFAFSILYLFLLFAALLLDAGTSPGQCA